MDFAPQPHIRNVRETTLQIAYLAMLEELRRYDVLTSANVEAVGETLCRNCGTLIVPGNQIVRAVCPTRSAWRHLQCPSKEEIIWELNRVDLDILVDTLDDCMRQRCARCDRTVVNERAHRVLRKEDDRPKRNIILVCDGCRRRG